MPRGRDRTEAFLAFSEMCLLLSNAVVDRVPKDPTCWQWPPCKGKGKGKRGKNKKESKDFKEGKSCKGKSTHESKREDLGEVLDDSESEAQIGQVSGVPLL